MRGYSRGIRVVSIWVYEVGWETWEWNGKRAGVGVGVVVPPWASAHVLEKRTLTTMQISRICGRKSVTTVIVDGGAVDTIRG